MESNIKISIIVPVYNVADYLEECLNSVLNQTLKNIEIIIINDGSTDDSPRILNKYKKYPSITIINQPNQGLSSARNTGIRHAVGEYIMFLDSDDWIDSDMCEKLYNKAKRFNVPLVICDMLQFWGNGKSASFNNLKTDESRIYNKEEIYELILSYKLGCHVVNKLYSKEYINQCLFDPGIYYEDQIFTFKVIEVCGQAVFINQALYKYRMRADSIIATPSLKKIRDYIMSTKKCLEIVRKNKQLSCLYSLIQAYAISNKTYALYLANQINDNKEIIKYINREIPISNSLTEVFFNSSLSLKNKLKYIKYYLLTKNT
ncbi:glycosyltransferase family 2 protein [Bacteroides mediterraneensis]|uniref:glycosyltransferase family 2 protein n=1 Tax=Bacteroides mediterraneensis TaxID=1841856 RepID=UPI0019561C60|nr:glycosyltransferase family 2 protein [Bacteroides mediterraneensis]MBM6781257.1 glycosyltransferase [Bacteroides mediterraneensis]